MAPFALSLALMAVACSGGSTTPPPASGGPTGPAMIAAQARGVEELPTDRFALPTFDYDQFKALLGQPDTIFFDSSGQQTDVWSGPIGFPELVERFEKILPP